MLVKGGRKLFPDVKIGSVLFALGCGLRTLKEAGRECMDRLFVLRIETVSKLHSCSIMARITKLIKC